MCHKGQKLTPHQLYFGKKPTVSHLRSFGTTVYVGIPKANRESKLSNRSQKGYIMGYALKTKGYRVWIPEQNKIIETINSKFEPNEIIYRNRVVMGPNQTSNVPELKAYDFLLENLTCNKTPMYNEDSDNRNNQSYYNDENNSSRETQNIKTSQPELTI